MQGAILECRKYYEKRRRFCVVKIAFCQFYS
jgi:hypothetical protein